MWIYTTGLVLSLFFAIFEKYTSRRKQKIFLRFLSMIPLTIIAAIRYNVGTDYFYTYAPGFQQLLNQTGMRGEQFEIGFQWLQRIIAFFTTDYIWLFIVTAGVFGILTYSNIFKQSDSPLMSIFLYFAMSVYFASLNMVRQSLAMAIVYFAMHWIPKKKPSKYIAIVLFASLFHASMLILLPVYSLSRIKWNRRKVFFVTITGAAGGGLIAALAKIVLKYIRGGVYLRYLGIEAPKATWSLMIAIVLFALAIIVNTNDWQVWFAVIGYLLACVMTWYIPQMSRIWTIFTYAIMLYYPKVLNGIRQNRIRWQVKMVFVLCFSIYVYITISGGGQGVLPYQTIFQRVG